MPDALNALRDANPRADDGFAKSVESAADAVRTRVTTSTAEPRPRRHVLGFSAAGAALTALAAVAAVILVGSPGGENASAAFERAAALTAASAERSGIAVVRITHDGELWAGSTIRWHGDDLAVRRDGPDHALRKAGIGMLVVDGILYGVDPRHGWVAQGSPQNIDPGSGTTPDEYLAAVREDVGGVTLQRVTRAMTGLATSELADGSTLYRGNVAAGLIARKAGFKEGQRLRMLPFGYVAHDEAADPAAPLDAAVRVSTDGIVREIVVSWGTWRYTVSYSRLGTAPALVAPANAKSLVELRRAQARDASGAVGRP
jgi:hypothetical protein